MCLDFANTIDNRPASYRRELLNAYPDLVAWSRQARIVSYHEARRSLHAAARDLASARNALREARNLRETIYGVFSAVASKRAPRVTKLGQLNSFLSRANAQSQIIPTRNGFKWEWIPKRTELNHMLLGVARAAVDLLTSADHHLVRECAGDNCGWLFMDRSKNHSRRWCDMKICGNRSKVRRYRRRLNTR